jgi:hypothetical protein
LPIDVRFVPGSNRGQGAGHTCGIANDDGFPCAALRSRATATISFTHKGKGRSEMLLSLLQTIVAGLVGFVGGLAALWAQQRFAWKPQKRTELRSKIFDQAVHALARYETDALDLALQEKWQEYSSQGERPHVVLQPETRVALEKARLQVRAFFPTETFNAFDAALRADVRVSNIPNRDFTEKSDNAMKLMAKDLGLL